MKLKDGFILREVAGQTVVLPVGGDLDLNMMITLNETGAFLWKQLENENDEAGLVAALLAEYDVDEATAKNAVEGFVAKLNENGFLAN
ncbi:MAG: PqqD family protein [Oscillospiraceae bacterium]|nr:PqqD family protein [Oscillospiraceae bacterium]